MMKLEGERFIREIYHGIIRKDMVQFTPFMT